MPEPVKVHRLIAWPAFPSPMPMEIPARANPVHRHAIPGAIHLRMSASTEHPANLAPQAGIPRSHPTITPAITPASSQTSNPRALTPPYSRATSLNHRSDPAEILPNSNQGSQPQSIPISSPVFGVFLVKSPGAMCEKERNTQCSSPAWTVWNTSN